MIIKIMVLSIESTAMKIFLEMYTWKLALTKSEVKQIRLQNCMFGIQLFKIILKEGGKTVVGWGWWCAELGDWD